MNSYRFEGKYTKELENDHAALEEANTWHDECAATVEKWFGPIIGWAKAADPLYHPQFFNKEQDGGWIMPDGTCRPYDS